MGAILRCLAYAFILSAIVVLNPVRAQNMGSTTKAGISDTIEAKTPVFAAACKACPWGILGIVTTDALKFYGYNVKMCWVCATSLGPREIADKTKPVRLEMSSGGVEII